jgi:hypothetical protein
MPYGPAADKVTVVRIMKGAGERALWIPLVVLVAYTFGPVVWPPLFTAALGRLTRIALERAFAPQPRRFA